MSGSKPPAQDGRPAVVVYEAQSGVIFYITPINLATLRAIQLKAADMFSYPDQHPYQQLEENAAVEGQLTPAEDNPAYIKDCQAVDGQRTQWADRAIFDYAVRMPKYPTRIDLIAAFAEQLARLRTIALLPEDDYEAVLFHIVLTWNQPARDADDRLTVTSTEYGRILQLAIQTVALTPDEVTAGVRFFRPYLSERRP